MARRKMGAQVTSGEGSPHSSPLQWNTRKLPKISWPAQLKLPSLRPRDAQSRAAGEEAPRELLGSQEPVQEDGRAEPSVLAEPSARSERQGFR